MNSLFNNLKRQFKSAGRLIWRNLFFVLIILFVLDLLLAALVFWQVYLLRESPVVVRIETLQINQALLDDFSSQWQKRESDFEKALQKQYPDPFRGELIVE